MRRIGWYFPKVRAALLVAAWGVLQGCGGEGGGEPAAGAAAPDAEAEVGATRIYDWFMEGTPAGRTTIVATGDGRITNESFVHWNNREYEFTSELRLDPDGRVIAQQITGTSPYGARIDESFVIDGEMARWRTVGESGSATAGTAAVYVPVEFGAVESLGLVVQKAANSLDGSVSLYPAGTARVERLVETTVPTPAGERPVSLYAVSGIDFTPLYLWMDEDLEIVARDFGGWLGMLPEGWDQGVLAQLSELQTEADAAYIGDIASRLAYRPEVAVVFENVAVADVEEGRLLENRWVVVRDGVIVSIDREAPGEPGALRIDGRGKTLIPGLWDMHAHFGLADGILNIAGGITSVRDIGGVHDKVMEMTARFDSGELIGPHTYRAGFMDRAGPFASGWAANSLDEALERVDFFAEHGYIQIKTYSSIEPEWIGPIAERAHAHGMRLSGHVPAFMSAEQAVHAGFDEIQHINMVFLNFLAGDREDTRKQLRFTLYGEAAGELDLDSPEVEDFIALLRENDVVVDPTAAIFETMMVHMPGEPETTFAAVIDHLPSAVRRPMYNPEMDEASQRPEVWARSAAAQSAMLRKLYENGVQLVPGSDDIAAFTLHRELEVYAEAGIPDAAVLRIATLDSARVVGVDERTGSITPGKAADLVLVEGNPLEDISSVRRAALVMKAGTLYRPEELYRAVGVEPFVDSSSLGM